MDLEGERVLTNPFKHPGWRNTYPSSVDSSGRATSTAKSEKQNSYGSSQAASQPSGSEDRRRSDEKHNGEWQDVNDGFFRCTAWRSVAENASRTLKKGMRVMVTGKLVQRTWQDNDGGKRQTVEIQVTHVGPDLQFQSAEVGPRAATPAEEQRTA